MSSKLVNNLAKEVFIYVLLLFILLLTSINIDGFLNPVDVKVLGSETQVDSEANPEQSFWQEFLAKNPNYVPGWIEMGNTDKAMEIDPNYILKP